ncbi:MAG: ATP-binding protein, partial [Mangrovibacterium sp.]
MNTNTEQIIPGKDQLSACLKSLKLSGIHSSLHLTTQTAIREGWPYDRFLFALLQSEKQLREENHRKAQVRKAGFPQYKYLEDLDRK